MAPTVMGSWTCGMTGTWKSVRTRPSPLSQGLLPNKSKHRKEMLEKGLLTVYLFVLQL